MKKYHKINPFWTYSRSERLGIAILTIGILFNAFIKWKNNLLLQQNIQRINEGIVVYPSSKDTIKLEQAEIKKNQKPKTKIPKKSPSKIRKINLAISSREDLIHQNIDTSVSELLLKERYNYESWRSICSNDPNCKKLLDNKQLYFWLDQSTLNIDLNQADSSQLKLLKGIGSVLSKRIIKYRDRLGGFVGIEQLLEVWGLNQETYQQIENKVFIGDLPEKKKISQYTDYFINHPYIPYNTRSKLNNYLKFNNTDSIQLKHLNLPYLKDSTIIKLSNYFE